MNAVVAEVMRKISDGRAADSGASRAVTSSRLANLLAILRRHERHIRDDALALRSPSTPLRESVDNNSIVVE